MEICPYHDTEPVVEETVARERVVLPYTDENGRARDYVLPKLVVFRVYCPACRERRTCVGCPPARFGKGYSAKDRDTAVRRWNSACATEKLRLFKSAVKGRR